VNRFVALLLLAPLAVACAPSQPAASAQATTIADVPPDPDDTARSLFLPEVRNARDLGGLAGAHGPIPSGRFLRTATLAHATEDDKLALLRRGVTLDIDLRTELEIEQSRDALARDPRFHYEHISLFGVGILQWWRQARLAELYVYALGHNQRSFRDVFRALAADVDGAVLFHCASGKDRTGLTTALLLSYAGVDRAAIVHDYAISSHYLRRTTSTQRGSPPWEAPSSPPSAIEAFLDALDREYGGARAYLLAIGLTEGELAVLSRRLGQ
jgi:protein-tyrosine phosphatase